MWGGGEAQRPADGRCLRHVVLMSVVCMLCVSVRNLCLCAMVQVCQKVPVQKTKQICNHICTKTTTVTETINTTPTVMSSGKGGEAVVTVSTGKGHRRLAGTDAIDMLPLPLIVGKAMLAKVVGAKAVAGAAVISKGKGAEVVAAAPQEDVQCNDVSVAAGLSRAVVVWCVELCLYSPACAFAVALYCCQR